MRPPYFEDIEDALVSLPAKEAAAINAKETDTIDQLLANPENRYGTVPNYGVTPRNRTALHHGKPMIYGYSTKTPPVAGKI